MGEDRGADHISRRRVLYELDGVEAVNVRCGVEFPGSDGAPLLMDVYSPTGAVRDHLPAVVLATGYRDAGFAAAVGCPFKDTGFSVSWARLIAASGLVAMTYTNREPVADLAAAVRFARRRTGIWATSGHVPAALSLLMRNSMATAACAAFGYGYMLDVDGAHGVADAAATFKFANPCAGRTVADLRPEIPMLIARAGQDQMPSVNESIDRFTAHALAANLRLTVINHPTAPHAFDLVDDSKATRAIVAAVLTFFRTHLL